MHDEMAGGIVVDGDVGLALDGEACFDCRQVGRGQHAECVSQVGVDLGERYIFGTIDGIGQLLKSGGIKGADEGGLEFVHLGLLQKELVFVVAVCCRVGIVNADL